MKYELIRSVTLDECPWLDRPFRNGEIVYRYEGCTYGCITPTGVACSLDGKTPFFELPYSALLSLPS